MWRRTKTSRTPHWLIVAMMVLSTALVLSSVSVPGQESSYGQRLSLNVYLDNTGKGLVTGYAENVSGLTFLNASQYRFENDTRQLYALTDGLTVKEGDLWTMSFVSRGNFDDYHVAFYLPGYMKLGKINVSDGLTYLLSASNESLVVDTQGYEVHDPKITIDYQQPLAVNPPPGAPGHTGRDFSLSMLLVIIALLIFGSAFAIFIMGRKDGSSKDASRAHTVTAAPTLAPHPSDLHEVASLRPKGGLNSADVAASPLSEQTDNGVYFVEAAESISPDQLSKDKSSEDQSSNDKPSNDKLSVDKRSEDSEKLRDLGAEDSALKNKIEVSSEMEAVMQTLTARERAVLSTLISHGGRMTQAEIRYGTGTPKSSLTGILISLERRKLITKKEWGRTNIIELSEWFLAKKERS
jgi:uncharacterized membrane protein